MYYSDDCASNIAINLGTRPDKGANTQTVLKNCWCKRYVSGPTLPIKDDENEKKICHTAAAVKRVIVLRLSSHRDHSKHYNPIHINKQTKQKHQKSESK
eukprot:scaffold363_cov56-Cylindrotheca_fusiformis.AAC.18